MDARAISSTTADSTYSSLDLDLLLGTLHTAETQVRWLIAEALPPAAQYRVEREATLRAHAALRSVQVRRQIELPPGWAEFVEVDDAIDALLERLVRQEISQDLLPASRAALPEIPPLPAELSPAPAKTAAAKVAPGQAAPPPAVVAPAWTNAHAPQVAEETPASDQASWSHESASDAGSSWSDEDQWGSEYGSYEQSWGDEAPYAETANWQEHAPATLVHEDAPVADDATGEVLHELELPSPEGLLDAGDTFPDDAGWTGPARGPEAIEPPVEARWTEPDIGFGGGEFAGLDEQHGAGLDPYAEHDQQGAVLSLGDIGLDEAPGRQPEDLLDEVIERTHAELTLDLPRDWEDDENTEVTEVVLRQVRPPAAAVQINPDGSSTVVGVEDIDEPSLASAIELGDESSQADIPMATLTGSFGVSVVGEDDDEDDDEVPSVSVEGVSEIVRAAIPDPARVRDWIAEADNLAARNARQAVVLYSDVIDAEPGNLRALLARGRLHLDRGDYTRAASDFLKAETRAPTNIDVQISLGDLFFARKEYGRATAYFDTALQLDPSSATAWYRRGLTRYYRREFQPALEDLEQARRIDPSLPSIESFIDKARRRQL